MELEQEDRVISEFLSSIGPWRNYVVIGGGCALFIYKLYPADQNLENPPVGTRDIDSLIPRRVPEISKKNSICSHLYDTMACMLGSTEEISYLLTKIGCECAARVP